jgi:GT2 family glycosyltransferase
MLQHDDDAPRVSVVILNYNRCADTVECVGSLKASSYSNMELLVVDNHSGDSSAEVLRNRYHDIAVVQTPANLGYTGGMNFGIRLALKNEPEYILVLNSDTLFESDAIACLVRSIKAHPNAALATGTLLYYPQTERIFYAGGRIIQWRASGFSFRRMPTRTDTTKVSFITGCAFIARASAFKDAGGFDERFFMYVEDAALSARLIYLGYELLYVPDARIFHKVEHEGDRPMPLYYSVRNRQLFLREYVRGPNRLIGFTYLYVSLFMKTVIWFLTDPQLAKASLAAVQDYRRGRFYRGRGLSFTIGL